MPADQGLGREVLMLVVGVAIVIVPYWYDRRLQGVNEKMQKILAQTEKTNKDTLQVVRSECDTKYERLKFFYDDYIKRLHDEQVHRVQRLENSYENVIYHLEEAYKTKVPRKGGKIDGERAFVEFLG